MKKRKAITGYAWSDIRSARYNLFNRWSFAKTIKEATSCKDGEDADYLFKITVERIPKSKHPAARKG